MKALAGLASPRALFRLHAPVLPAPERTRRGTRRRARAILGWSLALFALGQLLLGWLLQGHLEAWRDPAYGPKVERLEQRVATAEPETKKLVFLGSSRIAWGVRGQPIEEAFPTRQKVMAYNFGLTGASSVRELLTFERLRAQGIRPDIVVIEVLPALYGSGAEAAEIRRMPLAHFRWQEAEFARQWGADPEAMVSMEQRSRLLPSYTHRVSILNRTLPTLVPFACREDWYQKVDAWGDTDLPLGTLAPEARARARADAQSQYRGHFSHFPLGGTAPAALRCLLGRCQEEGIQAILLWMPEGREFQSWYPPGVRQEIETWLGALQREYQVPLVRACDWMEEDAFLDSHHLLPEHARTFSRRLGQALVPLVNDTNTSATNCQAGAARNR